MRPDVSQKLEINLASDHPPQTCHVSRYLSHHAVAVRALQSNPAFHLCPY